MVLISKDKFRQLSINEKADLVFNEGKYLAVRSYYNQHINLYLFNDYFVEVWYQPYENRIKQIVILEKEKTLDLYIKSMNKKD